jgi:hypothetical protein
LVYNPNRLNLIKKENVSVPNDRKFKARKRVKREARRRLIFEEGTELKINLVKIVWGNTELRRFIKPI